MTTENSQNKRWTMVIVYSPLNNQEVNFVLTPVLKTFPATNILKKNTFIYKMTSVTFFPSIQ